MGQPLSMPVLISPTGVQAVHPDGEIAAARAAAAAGRRLWAQLVRQQADRGRHRRQPADAVPDVLGRRARRHRRPHRAGPDRRCGRADPHHRLVVLPLTGLGQSVDPPAHRRADDAAPAPRRRHQAAMAGALGPRRTAPARPRGAQLRAPRVAGAEVLRRLRRVDADAAADVGRRRLARRAVGRPVDAQGGDARRGCQARPSTRGSTAISVSNHGGNNLDGSPAPIRVLHGDRRGGRPPGRGA